MRVVGRFAMGEVVKVYAGTDIGGVGLRIV